MKHTLVVTFETDDTDREYMADFVFEAVKHRVESADFSVRDLAVEPQ